MWIISHPWLGPPLEFVMVSSNLPLFCNTNQYCYHDLTIFAVHSIALDYFLLVSHAYSVSATSFALDTFIPRCLCTSICLGCPSTSSSFLQLLCPRILSFNVTASGEPSPSHIHLPHTLCTLTLLLFCISL